MTAAVFQCLPGRRSDRMPTGAQWVAVGGVVMAVHAAAVWGLLHSRTLSVAVAERAPLFVDWIAPPAAAPAVAAEPPRSRPAAVRPPAAPPVPLPVPPRRSVAPPARTSTPLVAAPAAARPAPFAAAPAESPAPPVEVALTMPAPPAPPAPPAAADSPTPPVPPAAPQPRTVSATAVQYVVAPAPEYPAASSRLRETGTVVVQVLIGEDGAARELRVARSSGHPRLDAAAVAALRKARFRPYTEDGRALAVWAPAPIEFELEK